MAEATPPRLINQERRGTLIFFQVAPGACFFTTIRELHRKFKRNELHYNEETGEFAVPASTHHHVLLTLINNPDYGPETAQ